MAIGFGSARDILAKTIRLGDHDYNVAGVMPKSFRFPVENPAPALWVSLAEDAEGTDPKTGQRGFDTLDVIGRLRPGVTQQQAQSDLSLIAGNLARQYPENNRKYSSALVEPELQQITGDTRPALHLLLGAVTLLLLIACANVAGLQLARGSRRSAEFALRASIGASRGVIVRQLLMESVALFLSGGLAGIGLAYGLLRGMVHLIPLNIPRVESTAIDGTVLIFVVSLSVLSGLLFGSVPAWRLSQTNPAQAMREGSRTVAGARHQHRLHSALVIAQSAIGLVLLVSSGLLIRSFIRILNVDPGFDAHHVLTARIQVSFDKLSHDQHFEFYRQLLARLAVLPGVQSAAAGWPVPMSDNNASVSFAIDGRPVPKGSEPEASLGLVMPGYFETLRIPLVSGRPFGERDGPKSAAVIIVNQAFARKFFPGENAVGKRIQPGLGDGVFNHPMREIVGVVGNIKHQGLTAETDPAYYMPYAQAVITNPYLTIRASGDPALLESAVRAAVHEMDPSVPVYQLAKLEDYVAKSAAQPRFQTLLVTGFAAIALLLAAVGLYGLLSYMVVERTFEIGLRIALGAEKTDVLRMVAGRGFVLALIGLAAGLGISALAVRLLSGLLYGTPVLDPLTFAVTSGVLLFVSLAASSVPAYRAASLDPIAALREH